MRAFKPQNRFQYRQGAENGPAGLWEPKGGARGKPAAAGRPRSRPRLRQGESLRSGCPWAAPGTPESHFPAPEGPKDGWTSKEAGKGVRSGHRGNRGDGLWAGPAVGTAARRPETSEKPRRRPQGGLTPTRIRRPPGKCIRRCPETGRNEPGQGGGPRKGAGNNPRRRSRE